MYNAAAGQPLRLLPADWAAADEFQARMRLVSLNQFMLKIGDGVPLGITIMMPDGARPTLTMNLL